MSDPLTKLNRSKRIQKSRNKGVKRFRDVKQLSPESLPEKYTHRFEDRSWFTCGNSNCVMCGNPRKFFGHKTLTEKSDEELLALEKRADLLLNLFESADDVSVGCFGLDR